LKSVESYDVKWKSVESYDVIGSDIIASHNDIAIQRYLEEAAVVDAVSTTIEVVTPFL